MNPIKSKVIVLLGPPGCGKGTQAPHLANQLQIPAISTGDLFRQCLKEGIELSPKAKECRNLMQSGKLIPDETTLAMLNERIAQEDCQKGYILDGFPRTLPQAEALVHSLPEETALIAFNFAIADEVVAKRIEGRLTCKQCGHVYNRYFSPPKAADGNRCDRCSGELMRRADDSLEAVQERLKVYRQLTQPLIAYFEEKGVLMTIDADQAMEKVSQQMQSKL